MAKSVLDICNQACDEMLISRPFSLANPTSDDDRQYAAVMNAAAEVLVTEPDDGWTVMETVYVFNSVTGQAEYPLPADYVKLVVDTVWDRSQLTPMQGPLSPVLWQTIKSGLIGNGIYFTRYRIVRSVNLPQRVFVVDPPSTKTGSPLVFEYQSNAPFAKSDLSSTSQTIQADTDVCILNNKLLRMGFKWRWRREKGLESSTFLAEYNEELDKEIAKDRPQPGFSMEGPRYRQNFLGYLNIPDTNYGH